MTLEVVLKYDIRMTTTKRKISVSLDSDLVQELERGGETLSAQLNTALAIELERQKRQRLLSEMLDEFEASNGAPEEELVQKYIDLLQ